MTNSMRTSKPQVCGFSVHLIYDARTIVSRFVCMLDAIKTMRKTWIQIPFTEILCFGSWQQEAPK